MTDVLVRSDAAGQEDEARQRDERPGAAPEPATRRRVAPLHVLLAALLVGAGAVHVAMAPSHLGESAVEGGGFLVAAWAQIGLAVTVLVRPARKVLAAVIGVSVVLIGAWAWSRTAGLPFGAHSGHAEDVSVVDGVCVAFEVLAVAVAGCLLAGRTGARARGLALVAAVGTLALATGVIASPDARDHAAASHGTHGEAGAGGAHEHGTEGDDLGFSELSNGHQHDHTTDEPLTARERVLLARQLASTAELVDRYPTLGHAADAGWIRAGPFAPGLGVHYISPGTARGQGVFGEGGTMDPDNMPTPVLVFDGLDRDAPLAGFMYQAYGVEGEPEGFAGPNDHWHYHESLCLKYEDGVLNAPFGADLPGITEEMCTDIGGDWVDVTGYMVHVWNVPGYESPDGMFTELNRKITCPDGTYHIVDPREIGNRPTACRD